MLVFLPLCAHRLVVLGQEVCELLEGHFWKTVSFHRSGVRKE
jgi:hypothetical protein